MKKNFITAVLYSMVTTLLLGVVYPLAVTGAAQVLFRDKANGQLLSRRGVIVGSRIIAQPFTGTAYFHPRPSAAGNGYDATNSGGSNLGPTNQKLLDRVRGDVAALRRENSDRPVPVDLVTMSGSGLDPDITPAGAEFQIPRVAAARGVPEPELRQFVKEHARGRQLGVLGEPAVNVLELNLALDERYGVKSIDGSGAPPQFLGRMQTEERLGLGVERRNTASSQGTRDVGRESRFHR